MKHAKRIITILIISILTISAVFISYIGIENGAVVFAEDVHFMTDQELESAYQAYLQSKGGGLIGTAGARYAYTTGKLLNFITSDSNTTGITTIDELKSQMKWQKQYLENGNGYLSLGITNRGMGLLNLYTQYLMQQHYFGDNVTENEDGMFNDGVENTVFSGYYYNNSFCYVTSVENAQTSANVILQKGTPYNGMNGDFFSDKSNGTVFTVEPFIGQSINLTLTRYYDPTDKLRVTLQSSYNNYSQIVYQKDLYGTNNFVNLNGDVAYYIVQGYNDIYFGFVGNEYRSDGTIGSTKYVKPFCMKNNSINDVSNQNIIFYTNNNNNINVFPTINEGDNLYITPKVNVGLNGEIDYQPYTVNEGDTITNVVNNYYVDSGTKDKTITVPSDTPDTGGGGSSDGPTGGNPPNWSNPFPHLSPDGEGGFNFNFQLPDLNIDWNISGLTEKFPFSIPFDFVAFCRVLDAEPETPALQCDIDLKLVTWHVDYDLHQFDDIASLLRNLEFIAFCIALVIMTRNMIKG